jgi:hypothetical protein
MKRLLSILLFVLFSVVSYAAQGDDPPVSLYPVPLNTNILKIKLLPSVLEKAKTIELRNFIGRKLRGENIKSREIEFGDMSQYPEGVYVIIIKDGSGKIIESAKFMIAK